MNKYAKSSFLIIVSMLLMTAFLSCEWDDLDSSDDPEHPSYVSYTISADTMEYQGPEQLIKDIKAWIRANQIMFDRQVSYTTGDPSEFAKTDAEALRKYEEFVPKFKNFLDDTKRRIAEGAYSTEEQPNVTVKIKFYTFASRVQGKCNNLKSDYFELIQSTE